METYYRQYAYPGKKVLELGKGLMQSVLRIDSALEFFAYVSKKQDDFYDFAEDYEPVNSFFGSEQKQIFTKTLEMLHIYDDSKTYIVNEELEDIVAKMRSIVHRENPYGDIPKLPELRDKFMNVYNDILQAEEAPVLDSINQAKNRVTEILATKEYAAIKRDSYVKLFDEIYDGAESCNNVSSLRSYADKADALKIRLLNDMNHIDAVLAQKKAIEEAKRKAAEASKTGVQAPPENAEPIVKPKMRKIKNVSIKKMTGTASWRLENTDDVEKYINELKRTLLTQLNEDTIVNVEF
jgi:hypothetical protein